LIYLFFLSGAKKGKIESADAQVVRIGRQPYCEISLDAHQDIPASGDHCHIIREADGSYFVLDSGSTFGTFLNGDRIQGRIRLSTGDVIECGKDPGGGREGPRLKFYLETDIRKCPVCSAPVYKRHFRCPDCRKKTCLRCIDFQQKVCRHCADARQAATLAAAEASKKAAAIGFEVIEDETVAAKRPARVIVKGKEAERLRRKKKTKETGIRAPSEGPAQVPVNIETTFCEICHDFVKGKYFTCPACQRPLCVSHQTGKVCKSCAGVAPAATAPAPALKKTRMGPTAPARARDRSGAPPSRDPSSAERRPGDVPVTPVFQRAAPDDSTVLEVPPSGVVPAPSGRAVCVRCGGRMGAGTFACRSCQHVLCGLHHAIDDCCDDCYLAGLDRRHPVRPAAPPAASRSKAAAPPGTSIAATRFFDRGRVERSLADTPPPGGERPPGYRTVEISPQELESQRAFDPSRPPTLSEIEGMDMMPLLDADRDDESVVNPVHTAETRKDFPVPMLESRDDLAPRPPSSSEGLVGLSFVCPHCDAPLAPGAHVCARCRRTL
jgi:hypothetical protein